MHLVEQIGSGIARIKDLMKQSKLHEPVFLIEGMFSVTLMRPLINDDKTREKTGEKIINAISENGKITTGELAIISGVSIKGVEYHLQKLKKEGSIKRKGSDKGGYWKLINLS